MTGQMRLHDKIFCYGTLKSTHGANHFLRNRAEFIGEDHVEGSLYNLGAFPGFKTEGSGLVKGEVYEITDEDLPTMLDNFESYPSLYNRVMMRTEKGYNVWVYVLNQPMTKNMLIEEGVW